MDDHLDVFDRAPRARLDFALLRLGAQRRGTIIARYRARAAETR